MNINEEQNRAKLIKLRKRHLIVKQRFYKSFGIQYIVYIFIFIFYGSLALLRLNVHDANFSFSHAIEREATTQL